MKKQIDLDFEQSRYTPFSLMEYTSAMTEETGIRVIESSSAETASVDPITKTIIIPAVDYSKPMTRERYRITKGYIDHEIAHMLYPDTSYLGRSNNVVFNIANLIDDIRIESLHAKNYVGIDEDFHNLNQVFYDDEHFFNRDNLPEKSLSSIMGTIALSYFGIKHKEPFNQEVFDFLNKDVFPIIDNHIRNPSPNALNTAEQIEKLINDFLKQESSPIQIKISSSEKDNTGTADKTDTFQSDDRESESKEQSGSPTAGSSSGNAENKTEKTESTTEQKEQNKEASGCDVSSHMVKRIGIGSTFTPPSKNTIGEYHDTVADLADNKCLSASMTANTNLYQLICNEYKAVISSYRNMFGSFLISTSRCRVLKTYAGKFNHRDVVHAVTSSNPRIFTREIKGRQFGYDVSLLMDCSGSMGNFSGDIHTCSSKIDMAYKTLVILAEALHGLSGINFEILAFTADSQYKPGWSRAKHDRCNNQLFILKAFNDNSIGALPYFPSYHRDYDLPQNNFDIGAIKLSSRRLRLMPSENRKLLIVLSDGQPSSEISHGTALLRSYVEELSHIHPIMGIGLENPLIEKCYPEAVNLTDLSELGGHIFNCIKAFLIKQMRYS
jgi:cobalamin biosynthesis protein CobT